MKVERELVWFFWNGRGGSGVAACHMGAPSADCGGGWETLTGMKWRPEVGGIEVWIVLEIMAMLLRYEQILTGLTHYKHSDK